MLTKQEQIIEELISAVKDLTKAVELRTSSYIDRDTLTFVDHAIDNASKLLGEIKEENEDARNRNDIEEERIRSFSRMQIPSEYEIT